MRRTFSTVAAVAAVALLATACGGSDTDDPAAEPSEETTASEEAEPEATPSESAPPVRGDEELVIWTDATKLDTIKVVADAFAEGRITRPEYDERADAAMSSRTLGDLVVLVHDLPVVRPTPRSTIADQAARAYTKGRREAVWGFLSASLICWVIWIATGFDDGGFDASFPWPLFVMLGTGLNAARVTWQRSEIIEEETRRLEKKERKELKRREGFDGLG